ncbi:hypothetical protein BOTBODRAFT_595072, partial [Botryobasidium botryosum FD-172 SS1]
MLHGCDCRCREALLLHGATVFSHRLLRSTTSVSIFNDCLVLGDGDYSRAGRYSSSCNCESGYATLLYFERCRGIFSI